MKARNDIGQRLFHTHDLQLLLRMMSSLEEIARCKAMMSYDQSLRATPRPPGESIDIAETGLANSLMLANACRWTLEESRHRANDRASELGASYFHVCVK